MFGDAPSGLHLRCRNAIPHARGLGSSAAAAVAGAAAAAVLAGRDLAAERDALLQITAGMEGHADNAAASLLGGFVVAWNNDGRFDAVRVDAHPGIVPVALVPEVESSTATTRGLLPDRVPLADAAFTGSRTALAVLAFTQRPDLLLPATADRLHQEYRRPAYPESAALVDALRAAGVPAVISGAGPTVLALTADGTLPSGLDLHGFTVLRAAGRPVRRHRRGRLSVSAVGARTLRRSITACRDGGLLPPQTDASTLGGATAIHASSAWPLEPGQEHKHCPQTARAALPRNRDDRRPARSGRLPTPRSTRQSSGTPSGRA